jgi:hypothetical protein
VIATETGQVTEEPVSLTDAMQRRVARIRTHCIRQDMAKRPNDALAALLVHVSQEWFGTDYCATQ